jgi:hypothetical protein
VDTRPLLSKFLLLVLPEPQRILRAGGIPSFLWRILRARERKRGLREEPSRSIFSLP